MVLSEVDFLVGARIPLWGLVVFCANTIAKNVAIVTSPVLTAFDGRLQVMFCRMRNAFS